MMPAWARRRGEVRRGKYYFTTFSSTSNLIRYTVHTTHVQFNFRESSTGMKHTAFSSVDLKH